MKITLYRNCILNDNYSQVFCTWYSKQENLNGTFYDTQSPFELYLNTLEKRVYEINQMYLENDGTIAIPLETYNDFLLFELPFNYMKIELENNSDTKRVLERFCFINKIRIKNKTVLVDYTLDFWHTYSKFAFSSDTYKKIPDFVTTISRSRLLSYRNGVNDSKKCDFATLPIKYMNNRPLSIIQLETTNDYCVFAQVQPYETSTSGSTTERYTFSAVLSYGADLSDMKTTYSYDDALELVRQAVLRSAIKGVFTGKPTGSFSTDVYYNIHNFTIIPSYLIPDDILELKPTKENSILSVDNLSAINKYLLFNKVTNTMDLPVYYRKIKANYKRIGIGTLMNSIEVVENGIDYDFMIYLYIDDIDLKVLLGCQGKFIDITSSFVLDYPIESIDGSVLAQQRIARNLSAMQNVISIGEGVAQIAADIYTYGGATTMQATGSGTGQIIGGNANTLAGGFSSTLPDYQQTFGYETYDVIKTPRRIGYNGNINKAVTGVGKIANGIGGILSAWANVYSSNAMVKVTDNPSTSIKYGLCYFYINNPANEETVKKLTENNGYIVSEIGNIRDFMTPTEFTEIYNEGSRLEEHIGLKDTDIDNQFDIIKVEFTNFSYCTNEISNKIIEILKQGIKIWYTENV